MLTELLPLTLEFRLLSDEEGDQVEINSPDTDLDDDDGDDNDLPAGDADAGDEAEPIE